MSSFAAKKRYLPLRKKAPYKVTYNGKRTYSSAHNVTYQTCKCTFLNSHIRAKQSNVCCFCQEKQSIGLLIYLVLFKGIIPNPLLNGLEQTKHLFDSPTSVSGTSYIRDREVSRFVYSIGRGRYRRQAAFNIWHLTAVCSRIECEMVLPSRSGTLLEPTSLGSPAHDDCG